MRLFQPRLSRGFWYCVGLACAILIIAYNVAVRAWPRTIMPGELEVAKLIPGAASIERLDRPGLWKLRDATGQVSYAFLTTAVEPVVKGYRDQISALVGFSADGTITAVELVDHQETPYYMNMVLEDRFLEGLVGRDLKGPDPVPGQLDAVSGATVTSRAISRDVFITGHTVLREQLGLDVADDSEGMSKLKPGLAILAMCLAASSILFGHGAAWTRWVAWVGNLLIVGIVLKAPLSFAQLADLASGRPPGALNVETAVIMYAALVSSLVIGRFHCRAVCPFGAMQEMLARISGRRLRPEGPAAGLGVFLSQMRYLVLAGVVIAVFGGGLWAIAAFEPYALLFSGRLSWIVLLYAALALAPCLFFPRFWCRFLCPTGACLDILSGLTRRRKLSYSDDEEAVEKSDEG